MKHNEFYARDRAACAESKRRNERPQLPFSEYDKRHGPGKCEGTLRFDPEDEGAHLLAVCDVCWFEIAVPRAALDPSWRGKILLERSGIPLGLAEKPYVDNDDNGRAVAAMSAWLDDTAGKPPLLHGKAGVGKTHLLAKTGAMLCRQGLRVLYRDVPSLMNAERDYIDRPKGVKPLKLCAEAEVLILDDLGAERSTPWTQEQLQTLIDARYKAERPILSATNLDLDEWSGAFGERTVSRLGGMTQPVYLGGVDMRLADPIPF